MKSFLLKFGELQNKAREWMAGYSKSHRADEWLAIFSFIEASFFPLPPSALMTAIITAGAKRRWIYYATLTTIFSVLGGLFGYLIGFVFYDTVGKAIVETYGLSEQIASVGLKFEANAFVTILVAAFTPIPYKVFTLSAGFFGIDILVFTVASIIGRGARFYAVAYFLNIIEKKTGDKYTKHINTIAIAVAGAVIVYFFYKIFALVL